METILLMTDLEIIEILNNKLAEWVIVNKKAQKRSRAKLTNANKKETVNNQTEKKQITVNYKENAKFKKVGLKRILFEKVSNTFEYSLNSQKQVTGICISKCNLKSIPKEIKHFESLTHLNLKGANITDISVLNKNLGAIDLSENNIEYNDDYNEILTTLFLSNVFGKAIRKVNLRKITKSRETERNILEFCIDNNNITALRISNMDIEKLPNEISHLTNLNYFNISGNNIKNIKNIKDVFYNLKLKFIFNENPLVAPPIEIAKQGTQEIRKWFSTTIKKSINEVKMIFLGDGLVGKSSIIAKLKNIDNELPKVEERTSTLEVKDWSPFGDDKVKINIWDFGGQGKHRNMQQFFCTPNTFFVYVDAPRDEEIEKYYENNDSYIGFDYWFSLINQYNYSNKKYSVPIFYVQNKIDIETTCINEKDITEIIGETQFSKITCEKIEDYKPEFNIFERDLKGLIKEKNEFYESQFNNEWFNVKTHIENIKSQKDYISLDYYYELCEVKNINTNTVNGKSDADKWLEVLSNAGTILHFSQIEGLKNIIIINPDWLRKSIQLLYDSEKINNGILNKSFLRKIWDDYSSDDIDRLKNLLKYFNIFYEENNNYIFPAFLDFYTKDIRNHSVYKEYVYKYNKFFPVGIFWELVLSLKEYKIGNEIWKNRAIFKKGDVEFEIIEKWKSKKIQIFIKGNNSETIKNEIFDNIEKINLKFEADKSIKLNTEKRKICNCSVCNKSKKPEEYLISVKSVVCEKSGETVVFGEIKYDLSNYIKIDGNNNIILQDTNAETIEININDCDSLKNTLEEFKNSDDEKHIQIFNLLEIIYSIIIKSNKEVTLINKKLDKLLRISEETFINTEIQKDELQYLKDNFPTINIEEISEAIIEIQNENTYTIVDEILKYIDFSFDHSEGKQDKKLNELFEKYKKTDKDNWKAKVKFGIPLLSIIGIDFKFENEIQLNKYIKKFKSLFKK